MEDAWSTHSIPDFRFALRRESRKRGSNSGVESQPSKLLVAGSNPVSRSIEPGIGKRETENEMKNAKLSLCREASAFVSRFSLSDTRDSAHVAQSVEHVLGKDEVTSSILVVGSMSERGPGIMKNVGRETGNGKRESRGGQDKTNRRGTVGIDYRFPISDSRLRG